MTFLIETFDNQEREHIRKEALSDHLRFLAAHASKLIACGSKKKDDGSDLGGGIYIIDVDHRSDAEAFIAQDPYKLADLFERVEIIRWNKAYVDGRCYMSTE
ncbi:MAG: YciI family protein [Mycobacterium sp.]|nr:YciI family protein [Mycobacterium sp.]